MGCITSCCQSKPLLDGDNEYQSLVVSKPNPIQLNKIDMDDLSSSDIPLFQVNLSDNPDYESTDSQEAQDSNPEPIL
ncbi:hypothetical protein TVAG_343230 [Trichomonas vaginalis G3]|uniref:Uncharacterized protein n=1 Tax=Trichomonas vaginalis (strain ATCC PRA-98 / G3) TaxID=412133 RepID=A2E1C7_TRIV3|nr:hypothetical protein TVAGG3_0320280 [Trichomonas vaginalis G3]EAY13494.1 hypothetical protein TVAG_343230 [Trichomonas vaginalis G3]KAI5529242.1 hypothetical protein TVAGG3_0320280 [Trichomonas vaginalis G3]|eukprot:XP_001325717.1 hypothetical protein [Trichomonas vaginalis G3]